MQDLLHCKTLGNRGRYLMYTISPPNITAETDTGKLAQLQSFLFQLVEQLNYVNNTIEIDQITDETRSALGNVVSDRINKELKNQYDQVKSIVVKTADLVQASYDQLSTELHSNYVAQSEFGAYTESANARIDANASSITQYYTRLTDLETNVNTVDAAFTSYKQQTSAYIKTGYLYDETVDGVSVPRYGLAIGESLVSVDADGNEVYYKENQCATIIAGELAFWQNGVKIAYFNGTKLVVTSSIQIGDWLVTNENGLTFRYIGDDA